MAFTLPLVAVAGLALAWTQACLALSAGWTLWGSESSDDAEQRSTSGHLLGQLVGLSLLAAVLAVTTTPGAAGVVGLLVLGATALAATRPAATRQLSSASRRVGEVLAWVARAVVLVPVALFVVVIPWMFQRVTRLDPTWAPRGRDSHWIELQRGAPPRTDRLWSPDLRLVRTTWSRRLHRLAVAAGTAVIATAIVLGGLWVQTSRAEDERYSVPALADSPWWPAMSDAMDMAYGRSPISSFAGVMMLDASYPGFNVTDRRRHSWAPPVEDCDPVTVWMFGGSTLFGLGQRDDHTIASELARAAWHEGLALDVQNWGVPADTYWMEVRRLELALAEGREPPDLVVFYDGANDYRVQSFMSSTGRAGELMFPHDLDVIALDGIRQRNARLAALMELTRRAPALGEPPSRSLTPMELGELAARSYAATTELVEPLLDDRGIDHVQFFQPTRASRSRPVDGEADRPGADDHAAEVHRAFGAQLGPDVVDLSGVMDSTDVPVYYDELHTNERGAEIVADEMLQELRPRLESHSVGKADRRCR